MTIGERIKTLRKKQDLTQEKLADFLCVSYQAVSKWECGLSSPDLALIVPLAKLLKVTTDELLGATAANNDTRYEELESQYNETFKSGDLDIRLNVAETAIKEYPGDMKWLNNYAWDIWCRAIGENLTGEAFEEEREKAIKLFDTVIENTDDAEIKVNAITGITQCLCGKGCKKEARKYVELFPDTKITPAEKDKLIGMCLEGEEQIQHKQQFLKGCLDILICTLLWDTIAEKEAICSAAEGILKAMIPDENYCNYHFEMSHIQFRKAEIEVKNNNLDTAIQLLKKSIYHAKKFDLLCSINPGEYTFTTPLFNKLTLNSRTWYHTGKGTHLDNIKYMCNRESLKVLREHKEYQSLFEE